VCLRPSFVGKPVIHAELLVVLTVPRGCRSVAANIQSTYLAKIARDRK